MNNPYIRMRDDAATACVLGHVSRKRFPSHSAEGFENAPSSVREAEERRRVHIINQHSGIANRPSRLAIARLGILSLLLKIGVSLKGRLQCSCVLKSCTEETPSVVRIKARLLMDGR